MKRHNKRWLAAAAVLLTVALPLNWVRLGERAALVAVGLRSPVGAVSLLNEQLTAYYPAATPSVPPPHQGVGDTTAVELPVAAPIIQRPPLTMTEPPAKAGDGGYVVERTMDTGNRQKGVAITNRSGTAVDVAAALAQPLWLQWEQTDQPQVLILHTHTTEGYMTYEAGYYNAADRQRTHDHTRNVCAVGEMVRRVLASYGIVAIHDTTVHDNPVYSGAYTRSAQVAQTYLEQYPSIRVVLDLHRDSVMEGEALVRPTATVEGKKAAQLMLITGVVDTEALPHPHWQQNFNLSAHWQQALDDLCPDLMRPLNTVASRYNQHLSPGWVLVEVGAEGNTVEEAVTAAELLAHTLAQLPDAIDK